MLAPVAERSGIPFRVVLASGTVAIDSAAPAFSFVFRTKRAQRRVALQGYVGLLEAILRRRRRHRRRSRAGIPRRIRKRRRPRSESDRADTQPLARTTVLEPLACAGEGKRDLSLRTGSVVLSIVARPARDDVHLRLLERGHDDARGGAAQQDGPCLPQGPALARRDLRRRRLRLGRSPVPRAGTLRRDRHGHQYDDAAGRGDARGDRPPRTRRQALRRRMRFPRDPRPVRQAAVDRNARARRSRPVAPR